MRILVLNGPNLNLLGVREPGIYGNGTYKDLEELIKKHAREIGVQVDIRQTNHEGTLVEYIQSALDGFDGIVINPAAYTHTSVAILDAAKTVKLPVVEVHISDVSKREDFRQISYIRAACIKTIAGHGFNGYLEAMDELVKAVK
jgi:3-dehydroquinate dehydratase-2